MGIIQQLIPLNLDDEREKFFSSNSYNPQFRYAKPVTDSRLRAYGKPLNTTVEYARRMLEKCGPPDFSLTEPPVDQSTLEQELHNLLTRLGLPTLKVLYGKHYSARIMLSVDGLHIRLPIRITQSSLHQVFDHEIQTHYLRSFNHSLQAWKKDFPTSRRKARITEEGLALINTYQKQPEPFRKQFIITAAEGIALHGSFREVFEYLKSWQIADDTAWRLTLKQKRGLSDTSQPGGFLKSHIYLEGARQVFKWVEHHPEKLQYLYAGKLATTDLDEIIKTDSLAQNMVLPIFLNDYQDYLNRVQQLRSINEM